MLYKTWNFRTLPFFREELPEENPARMELPAINGFQQPGAYSPEVRSKLAAYLNCCPPLVSTSFKRFNPYQQQYHMGLCYFTDGEVIFNDFLFDYILHEDFVLPQRWFEIIEKKSFKLIPFQLNFDLITSEETAVFKTAKESFDEVPSLKKLMIRA